MTNIVTTISIVGPILLAFAWLINFLEKKVQMLQKSITDLTQKLDDKVPQSVCQERRCALKESSKLEQAVRTLTSTMQQLKEQIRNNA